MAKPPQPPTLSPADAAVERRPIDAPEQLIAYQQNAETFRSLNQLMWQIPLIAMTLTGGLWFGVAKADTSMVLQLCLLGLAAAGNLGLIVVLIRLRFIMGEYLAWSLTYNAAGHVQAKGETLFTRPKAVRTTFQLMLGLAAAISLGLMVLTAQQHGWQPKSASERSVAYYDHHAEALADTYEALTFEQAHPALASTLGDGQLRHILDVGAGTGRDADAMQAMGHEVVAAEPSAKMRVLARRLHPSPRIRWVDAALPGLASVPKREHGYDIILLSAVWMHVHPNDRVAALSSIENLLAPTGRIFVTLRVGPVEADRAMFETSAQDFVALAAQAGLQATETAHRVDLLGRPGVRWLSFELTRSGVEMRRTAEGAGSSQP